ncbi:hypothetical protein L3073_13015 [Ancylomarina sp. DW003]|nr:hypothetical protein [Ancylomarina sp. DW003]MDE5423133.1 hypothetical protein [Ancylomarina sp. DW003]
MRALKIFVLACLLLIGGKAFSQSGSTPYINSTHTYRVHGGVAQPGNSYSWAVFMENGDPVVVSPTANADVVLGTNGGAEFEITWLKANLPANAKYIVQLTETDANTCSTIRQFDVDVSGNVFDILITDLTASCSDASGTIINSANDNLGTTSKTFTIDMKTQADMSTGTPFTPDWEFNYTITSTNGNLVNVSVDDNAAISGNTIVDKDASGKVTVNNNDYSIEFTVEFNNTWNMGDLVTVVLSNGKELSYNTLDDPNANTGSVTINALPATTNITTD